MKILAGILVMGVIVSTVLLATVIGLFVELSPYLLAAAVVFAVVRCRRRARPTRHFGAAMTARPVAPPAGGWVLVPVWMGPAPCRRRPDFIDAEVVDDGRDR